MAAERVLLSQVLSRPDQFYGRQVVLVGYVLGWSEIGAAIYLEFGAEHQIHAESLWFDWPKAFREQASRFHRKYAVVHGTVQPAPAAVLAMDGTMDKHRGWSALLEPATYLLPLSEHPVPAEASEQHFQDCERLLRSGKAAHCPFCTSSSPVRFVENGGKQYEGGYRGAFFVCGDCGRSFGPADCSQ
jgi:hypothetical protein